MAFNNYLEDENDKPYFTTNSLAYYYDKMEGFAEAVEGSAKALNLTKEEVEKRITLYIEQNKNELDQRHAQNKNELDQRLADWDGKLETFDSSVETLLAEWVDDGTLTHVIDSTLIDQRIAPVTAQLADKLNKSDIVKMPDEFLSKVKTRVEPPLEFTWKDAPLTIFRTALGKLLTVINVAGFEPVGNGKTYYLSMSGSSSNDGLTLATAKGSLNQIFLLGDADKILVDEGHYTFDKGSNQSIVGKNISIKAIPNKNVSMTTEATLTFSKTTGATNVYQASRTLVASVYDGNVLNSVGDYTKLKVKTSIAEVDAEAGSYFYSDSTLYVHPLKSRVPDNDVHVFLSLYNLRNTGDYITYTEGIKWYGGNNGTAYISNSATGQNPLFVAKDCEFKYSNEGNGGLMALGCDVILEKCVASSNFKDGFNYHVQYGRVNKVIEIECKGYHNGVGRSNHTDNGSTMHDGGKIIRVNGEYYANEGPNVHDVTTDTESWNLGIDSHGSVSSVTTRNNNYQIENGKMWLDTCIGYDSENAYRVPNGEMYIKNSLFDDGAIVVSGLVGSY